MRDGLWFIRHSWAYLGCDRGTGRWAARRTYLRGIVPLTAWFVRTARSDRRAE